MSDNSDQDRRLDDTAPLGKSVEQVEADNQNRVNSSESHEQREIDEAETPAIIPAAGQGTAGSPGSGVVAGILNPARLAGVEDSGADDRVNDKDRDETPE